MYNLHNFDKKMDEKKHIAVISLGGTISSYRDKESGAIFSFTSSEEFFSHIPTLPDDIEISFFCNIIEKKFFLQLEDYEKLYDFITENFSKFDGFVVLQETDSILFGSSLISFLCRKVFKPIIFIAHPLPFQSNIGDIDIEQCIYHSICFASQNIGEVCIYNNKRLIRAVRGKRRNIFSPHPFYSSGMDDLGEVDENCNQKLFLHRIRRENNTENFPYAFPKKKIFFVRLYPDYDVSYLDHVLHSGNIEAVVIESLGYGSLRPEIMKKIEELYLSGIAVVIIAEHDNKDRTFFMDSNNLPSQGMFLLVQNMTVWGTLAKSYICIENTDSVEDFYDIMKKNIAGGIIE